MSLLTLCQDAARLVGEPQMSHVIGNNDVSVARFLAHARLEGARLARAYPWQMLLREASLAALAQEDQGAITAIAPDFDRLVNGSLFFRDRGERIIGPLEEARWQRLKSSRNNNIVGGFRLRGGRLLLLPVPRAGETIAFEYVSAHWVDGDGDGVADRAGFAADTDGAVIDEQLILTGMVWRWLRQNGFAYEHAYREHMERLNEALGRDGGKATLVMHGLDFERRLTGLPDGNFGP